MDSDLYVAVNSEEFTEPFCVYLISKGVAGCFLSVFWYGRKKIKVPEFRYPDTL